MTTPASEIIKRLGGCKAVGDMLGISRNAVQRWTYEPPQGLGDRVPMKHWPALVALAGGRVTLEELNADFARAVKRRPVRRSAA